MVPIVQGIIGENKENGKEQLYIYWYIHYFLAAEHLPGLLGHMREFWLLVSGLSFCVSLSQTIILWPVVLYENSIRYDIQPATKY